MIFLKNPIFQTVREYSTKAALEKKIENVVSISCPIQVIIYHQSAYRSYPGSSGTKWNPFPSTTSV
jgi:hypothetical protein